MLAAAFVRPFRLLILDEPKQRLDAAGGRWVARRLRGEVEDGRAVLFSCHDSEQVDSVADRSVRL